MENTASNTRRQRVSRATTYADANTSRPAEHSNYDTYEIVCSAKNSHAVFQKIGRGKYSEVFSGVNRATNTKCVLKVLKPVRIKKIQREIKILNTLRDSPHIIKLHSVLKNEEEDMPTLVFEHIHSTDFRVLYPTLKNEEICFYMFKLLTALDHAHSLGIMHRDVKPHNIMIDDRRRRLRLIDWGLADFYQPETEYNVRVASKYYKGPELLVDYRYYDYSLDLWSVGCTFAGMIFRIDTFFRGRDNIDQLLRIIRVLGSDDFFEYTRKYSIALLPEIKNKLDRPQPKTPFSTFVTDKNADTATPLAVELLEGLLCYDHQKRLTAKEAMEHPYFSAFRASK